MNCVIQAIYMRKQLHTFTTFANNLLPHELAYIEATHHLQDDENIQILERIRANIQADSYLTPFDTNIDKRKYSNLKKWIQQKLDAIDVDLDFHWLISIEQKIATDAIMPDEEAVIMEKIEGYQSSNFYFQKFYELLLSYRDFLIIRLRFKDHQKIQSFIDQYAARYKDALVVKRTLYRATKDLTSHYLVPNKEIQKWENWLKGIFYEPDLDGQNRYAALVRLSFLYLHTRNLTQLTLIYDRLDDWLTLGQFYSRRLLVNYYANRSLLHAKLEEYKEAEKFGHLSLKERNTEYLQYTNNLASVFLRQHKFKEALQLMKQAAPEMRKTNSFHNKSGFVALYTRCLFEDGQLNEAERYVERYLRSNGKNIHLQRWYLLFTTYFQVLLKSEKYHQLMKCVNKYRLLTMDENQKNLPNYLPTISWYFYISAYKEGKLTADQLTSNILKELEELNQTPYKMKLVNTLLEEMYEHIPQLVKRIKSDQQL